jgi:hypothetical protein
VRRYHWGLSPVNSERELERAVGNNLHSNPGAFVPRSGVDQRLILDRLQRIVGH